MRNGNTDQTFIALTCADGSVAVMGFVTCEYIFHGPLQSFEDEKPRWTRLATKEEVEKEIARLEAVTINEVGEPQCALGMEKVPVRSWRFLTDEEYELTKERELRNALVDTGTLVHDMAKARELYKERVIRPARTPLFMQLDAEYMKADEAGDKAAKKRIAARKQELRDATADPAIDVATTVDELKSVGGWMKSTERRANWNEN